MHLESIVVCLTDNNKKPLRELNFKKVNDKHRKCNIHLPFNSEYMILVKNLLSNTRIKLDIDIDGTNVSSSGIIINGNTNSYIERFVDIAKKFKFVQATGNGADPSVADPTNPENGIIKIKVSKEKQIINYGWTSTIPNKIQKYPIWTTPNDCYWNTTTYSSLSNQNSSIKCLRNINTSDNVFTNENIGATVEGSCSNQKFSTTFWNGDDGEPYVFTFYLTGHQQNDAEYNEYQRLKKKFENS